MRLSRINMQKGLLVSGGLFASLLFAGCSHLYYADPNPSTPFVFPGQPAPPAFQSPSPTPLPTGPAPVPVNSSGLPPAVPMPGTGARPSSEILRISDSITVSFSDLPPPGQIPVTQRIRDDGKGIDSKLLDAGRDGHWGLPGMRERAQQIGAQFDMWSEVGAGTEVELRIPASVAYATSPNRGGFRLFRKQKEAG